MSDTNGFQFFVMIGGPFWCGLLLCFLCQWAYKVFKRWRERKWREVNTQRQIILERQQIVEGIRRERGW